MHHVNFTEARVDRVVVIESSVSETPKPQAVALKDTGS